MGIMSGIQELVNQARSTVSQYQTASPHTYGRIKQVVGGILVADGLVGLENPFDGRRTRPGILGSLAGLLAGVVVIIVGIIAPLITVKTDATTTGTITAVERRSTDDGESCRVIARFEANNNAYSVKSSYLSELCHYTSNGSIDIYYLSSDPSKHSVGQENDINPWIFIGAGLVTVVISLGQATIRGLSLFFGVKLWLSGRKMVKSNPPVPGDDGMVSEVKRQFTALVTGRAKSGSIFSLFNRNQLLRNVIGGENTANTTPAITAPPLVPPINPPTVQPGWYPTQDGNFLRWHDGTQWTDSTKPAGTDNLPKA